LTARIQLKKNSSREPQGAWRQEEVIGGKLTLKRINREET
jgi:hypothetical protein